MDLAKLRQLLVSHFSESELRDICFDLGVDYEDLPGESKSDKARELVTYFERRGCVPELVEKCAQLRANVKWSDVLESSEEFSKVRQEYCEYLIRELKDHTIRGFAPQVGSRVLSLPISQIFLPLQAVEGRPALAEYAEEDLLRQAASEALGELDWQRRREEMEKRYAQLSARQAAQRPVTLEDLLREPRSVLLGDPGTGKTTTTRYITYALAAGDTTYTGATTRDLTPVLIRIADYARACERDSTLHVVEYVEKELHSQPEFGRYLRRAIERGQCLVVLDGLDEVTNPALRMHVTDRIQEMVAGFGANRYMVTSRIVGYEQSPLTREFKHATLRELTPEDQERFIRLWYDAIKTEISGETHAGDADSLVQALHDKPQIARMAANPLLLTIIVLMHWRGVKLPSQRVQIYQIATDTLIEYWTAQRGVAELDAEEVKGILAPIAHYILSSNVAGVIAHHDLLPRFYQGIATQRGCDEAEARRIGREMLRNLNEQSGLFLERGRDASGQSVYGFLHQTFGEYLAALCLAEEVQSGGFRLEGYIHRSMWREPLLLMAGHLSIYSKPQANAVLREILDFPAPYEEVLQRNVLLAADCLVDDIQVQPGLRDEVLNRLAGLLGYGAPQVREAALERYQRLAVTRHRDAALAALKRAYALDGHQDPEVPAETRLSLATALLHLREMEAAQPILWPLEGKERSTIDQTRVQRLRFEGWPEQAVEYLVQLQADKDCYFPVSAGPDLASSTLGPVDAGLARRVLGETRLLDLLERLSDRMADEADKATLRWVAVLASETVSVEAIASLATADTPARVRRLAAARLLQSDYRVTAVAVLQDLAENEPGEAPAAAQALLEAGEVARLKRGLLRDTAMMANDDNAPQAIGILLQIGDTAIGLSAAFHLMATCQRAYYWDRDQNMWSVVKSLIANGYSEIGLAAARWLALRPGYRYRMEACEALLEAGRVRQTIPLLQYLVYECHGEDSQRACGRLLMLKEAERVVPLLTYVARRANPNLRYQACLALALADHASPNDVSHPSVRGELKAAILGERTPSAQAALRAFCQAGLEVLNTLDAMDDQAQSAQALGRFSLEWLAGSLTISERRDALDVLMGSPWPAVSVNAAQYVLQFGQVDRARQRLVTLLTQSDQALSLPVKLQAIKILRRIVGSETTAPLIRALQDKAGAVRGSAASALGALGDPAAVPHLIAALSDDEAYVRWSAASALGALGDPAVPPLIAALSDEEGNVRWSAASALGALGDPAAVPPLIAALSDEAENVRWSAADALGALGDPAAVPPLIAALSAEAGYVRGSAADALGALGDPAVVLHLIAALSDDEESVRGSAADALGALGDPAAVPHLIAALSDEEGWVRRSAAYALGALGDPAAVPHLITALSDEAEYVRGSAADALGALGDPAVVPHLIAALTDEAGDVGGSAADALGALGATETAGILAATSSAGSSFEARPYAQALVHLDSVVALPVLDRYARQFKREGWVDRLRGQAQWRLGQMDIALMNLQGAVEKEDTYTNLLALAHFHLEQADLQTAQAYVGRALEKSPREAICLLSRAILLWEMENANEALEALVQAQKRDQRITRVKALKHEWFWGPKALAALEAMLARSAANTAGLG